MESTEAVRIRNYLGSETVVIECLVEINKSEEMSDRREHALSNVISTKT